MAGATTSANAGGYTVPLGRRKKRMLRRLSPGVVSLCGAPGVDESLSEAHVGTLEGEGSDPATRKPYKSRPMDPKMIKAVNRLRSQYKLKDSDKKA